MSPFSIGDKTVNQDKILFEKRLMLCNGNTSVYLSSDGYYDQFGGENDRPFSRARFNKLIEQQVLFPMEKQKQALYESFTTWKADMEQLDDVLVVGLKV